MLQTRWRSGCVRSLLEFVVRDPRDAARGDGQPSGLETAAHPLEVARSQRSEILVDQALDYRDVYTGRCLRDLLSHVLGENRGGSEEQRSRGEQRQADAQCDGKHWADSSETRRG